jgi:hypothetical protein
MVIEQEVLFRQAVWELPFPVVFYLLGVQPPSGITYRLPLKVMKADTNTFIEESRTLIETGIKAFGGLGCDSLFF